MYKGFLSDIRVVEVGGGWVGPWAGVLLADLGAEIIKVESISKMDLCRSILQPRTSTTDNDETPLVYYNYPNGKPGERYWNRNCLYNSCNFSKYGVTIDLTKPKGLQAFMRIVKVSDVFLSNMAVSVDEKLGITYEDLIKVNPSIVYLTSTGYGRTGPYAKRVAMGNTIDAAAGFFGLRDYGDGDSTAVSGDAHCDSIASVNNAFAILAALHYRKKTGKGMFIDTCMVEPAMAQIGEAFMDYAMNHRIARSLGNRDASMTQGCYRCKGEDEWVTLSISSDEEWQQFTELMGKPQLAEDERFVDVLARLKNQDELDKLIEEWTVHHTKHEVMNILQQINIAAGAVLNNRDVFSSPIVKEQDFLDVINDPDAGMRTYAGRLWRLRETDIPKRSHSPCLGEHNDYVLKEIAGLTSEEIAEMEKEDIIGTKPIIGMKL